MPPSFPIHPDSYVLAVSSTDFFTGFVGDQLLPSASWLLSLSLKKHSPRLLSCLLPLLSVSPGSPNLDQSLAGSSADRNESTSFCCNSEEECSWPDLAVGAPEGAGSDGEARRELFSQQRFNELTPDATLWAEPNRPTPCSQKALRLVG